MWGIVIFAINLPSRQAVGGTVSSICGAVSDSLDAEVFPKYFRSSALGDRILRFFDNAGGLFLDQNSLR